MDLSISIFSFKYFVCMLKDWPSGTMAGLLMVLGASLLIGTFLFGLYIVFDSFSSLKKEGIGKIVSKNFTSSHISTRFIYNPTLKADTPYIVNHPDNWSLCIEVSGRQDDISVSHEFYDSVSEGDFVAVRYVVGRFSGDLYLEQVSLANSDTAN